MIIIDQLGFAIMNDDLMKNDEKISTFKFYRGGTRYSKRVLRIVFFLVRGVMGLHSVMIIIIMCIFPHWSLMEKSSRSA